MECISSVLGIDPKIIRQGQHDLEDLPDRSLPQIRKTGGGRKRRLEQDPKIDEDFQKVGTIESCPICDNSLAYDGCPVCDIGKLFRQRSKRSNSTVLDLDRRNRVRNDGG